MSNKIEKIKVHFRDNKKLYIGTAVGIVVGGVSVYLLSNRAGSGALAIQKINQIGFRNEANPTIINLIELSTPSKPVHLVGTNLYFSSISEAARETGHHLSMVSKNVNGLIPNVKGDVFELLELAA